MEEEKKQEEGLEKTADSTNKSFKLFYIGIAAALGIVIIFGLGLVCHRALKQNAMDNFTVKVARAINLPAGFVGSTPIAYADFVDDIVAVQKFYTVNSAQVATVPTIDEIRKSVWDRLVTNVVLNKLSREAKVNVGSEEIGAEYAKFVEGVGSEEKANQMIQDTYGWTAAQFKNKIIKPYLLQVKLSSVTSTAEMLQSDALKKAQEVLTKIKEGKESFEDLAKQYSEDGSAAQGGDLGWFGAGMMVKEFEDAVSKLEVGQTSDLVKSQFGEHIVKLVEKRKDANGATEWHAQHILIGVGSFDKYLEQKIKDYKIWKWIEIK